MKSLTTILLSCLILCISANIVLSQVYPAPVPGDFVMRDFKFQSGESLLKLGIVEKEIKRVKNGRFILLPITDETRGHGTHTIASIWQNYLAELLTATEKKN